MAFGDSISHELAGCFGHSELCIPLGSDVGGVNQSGLSAVSMSHASHTNEAVMG